MGLFQGAVAPMWADLSNPQPLFDTWSIHMTQTGRAKTWEHTPNQKPWAELNPAQLLHWLPSYSGTDAAAPSQGTQHYLTLLLKAFPTFTRPIDVQPQWDLRAAVSHWQAVLAGQQQITCSLGLSPHTAASLCTQWLAHIPPSHTISITARHQMQPKVSSSSLQRRNAGKAQPSQRHNQK